MKQWPGIETDIPVIGAGVGGLSVTPEASQIRDDVDLLGGHKWAAIA